MKKYLILIVSAVAIFGLSGCGSSDGGRGHDGPILETFFITDGYGLGVGGIIYHCDSGLSGITNFEGAFTFDIVGDNCNFDFYTNNISNNVYIGFDNNPNIDTGLNGIYFECVKNGEPTVSGRTGDVLSDGFIVGASLHDGCTLFDIH